MRLQRFGALCWQAVFLLRLAGAGAASAASCAQSQEAGVAVVAGAGRAYFHGDADLCPGRQAYCPKRAYAIARDRVLTSISQDGYTCVFAPGKNDTTYGWIETKRLRREAINATPSSSAWEGIWQSEGVMSIRVRRGRDGLQASGVDDWKSGDGYDDNGKIDLPGRNDHAEFSGRLSPVGNHARLTDGSCSVDLTLLDEFVIVDEDSPCGAGNTSFRGAYRRKR